MIEKALKERTDWFCQSSLFSVDIIFSSLRVKQLPFKMFCISQLKRTKLVMDVICYLNKLGDVKLQFIINLFVYN